LMGLEPKSEELTFVSDGVLPFGMGTMTLEHIPGRWGHTSVTVKGTEDATISTKEIFETILTRRATIEDEDLAA